MHLSVVGLLLRLAVSVVGRLGRLRLLEQESPLELASGLDSQLESFLLLLLGDQLVHTEHAAALLL